MDPIFYYGLAALSFVMGLLFGSFLNVAIYRIPLGLSVGDPVRSFCFRCGSQIAWFDNIPVVSYLALGGRDRVCGARYSARYALVELLTGGLFLGLFLMWNTAAPGGLSLASLWYMAFVAVLIVGTFTDLDHWIMPRGLTIWGTAAGLLAALIFGFVDRTCLVGISGPFPAIRQPNNFLIDQVMAVLTSPVYRDWKPEDILWWEPLANAAIGAVFAPLMLWLIGRIGALVFRREAMGMGDVDLFMMIGATLGPINSVIVLVLASFIGSFGGGAMMVRGRMKREVASPLALGAEAPPVVAVPAAPQQAPALVDESDEELMATRGFAESLELPFIDLTAEPATAEALAAVSPELRAEHQMWPLAVIDGRLRVACADPLNSRLVTALREAGHKNVEFVIARPSQIAAALAGTLVTSGASGASPATAPGDGPDALWRRFVAADSHLPLPPQLHMLPFIPWITLGCLIVLLAWPVVAAFMEWIFYPR